MTPDQKLEAPTDFYARNPGAQPFRGRLIEMRSQEDLLRGAFFQMKHMRQWRGRQLWTLVGAITGHGSGYSQQICEELGWRYDMAITPASHLPRATPAPTRTNTGAERNAGFLRSQCSSEKPPYGRRPGHAVVEISVDQAEEIAALLSRPSPAPTAPGESEGVFGREDQPQVMVYTAQIKQDQAHGYELGWHQVVMFGDHQRALDRHLAALREQLAELTADLQKEVQLSDAATRREDELREQLAVHRSREIEYLQMLSEQYPAAQSIGGTYLPVLLREKIGMLRAALPASVAEGET